MCILFALIFNYFLCVPVIIKMRTGILHSDHTIDLERACVALIGTAVGQGCFTLSFWRAFPTCATEIRACFTFPARKQSKWTRHAPGYYKNSFNTKVLWLCPAALSAILSLLGVFVSDKQGLVFANENVLVAGDNKALGDALLGFWPFHSTRNRHPGSCQDRFTDFTS